MSYTRKDWISGQVIRQQALDNIESGLSQIYPLAKNAVRYNQAQPLSTTEKQQALQNLGIDDLKTRIDKIESDIPKTWSGAWRHANLVINQSQNSNVVEVQEDASNYSGCALCGPISPMVEGDVYESKNLNLVFRLLFVYDGENGEAIRYGNWTQKYTINLNGQGVYNPSSVKRYYIFVKNVNTVDDRYDESILDLYLCQKYVVHRGSQQSLSVESMVTNLQPFTFSSDQTYKAGDYVKNVNDNRIYRFIVDHTTGGWLDTEVQEINLFDVLSKTLPQLTDIQTLYQGYIDTDDPHRGELSLESATTPAMPYARVTSDFIPLVNNHTIIKFYDVNDQTLPLTCRYYFYNESKALVSAPGDWHSNQGNNGLIDIDINSASEYVRVSIARINSKGQRSDSGILKPADVCLTASTAIHDTRAASKLDLNTVTNQVNDLQSKVMRKCALSFDYMAVDSTRYRPAMPDNPQSRLLSETVRLTGGTTFKINSNYRFIIWPWAEQDAVPYVNDLEYDSSKNYYYNQNNETWEEETLRLKYGSPITGQGIIFDNVNQKYIWGKNPDRLVNNVNEYTVDEKYNGMLVRFVISSAINSLGNIYPSDVVLLTDDPTIGVDENCVIDSEIINLVGSGSEYGLNITQQGASNMMMSYLNAFYPMAIRYSKHENKNSLHDKLYWGFTTADGYSGVASYDFDNQETVKTLLKHGEPDDHNMCAIYIYPEDGTIVAGYTTGHNAGPYLHFRRSLMGEDISHFDKETRLKANGNTTYMQFIRYNPRKEYASVAEAAAAAVANGWIESADNIDNEGYQPITINTVFYPEIIYYVLEGTTYKKVTRVRERKAIPDNNTTYYHNIWDYFPSDALYVFYRDGDTNWYYSKTQDKGITWSQVYPIVTNIASSASDFPKYYCKFQKTTTPGVIRIILFCNATEDKYSSSEYWDNQHLGSGYKYNHCRMGFLNLNDGTIHNANYFPDNQNYNKNDDQSLFKNEYRELISTDVEKLNNKFIPGICYYTNTEGTYKYVAWSTIMKNGHELYPNGNTYYTNVYTPNGGVNPLHFAIIRPKNMTGVFTKVRNITARKGMVYFEWNAENETNHVGTQLPQKTTLAANTDYGYWAFKTYLRVFDVKITDLHKVELLTGDMTGDTTTYYVDEITINETDPLSTYESEETSVNAALMTASGPIINHYGDWTPAPITQEKLMVWVSKYPGGACWSNSSPNDYKFSIISNDATGVNSSQFVNKNEYVSLYEYTPKNNETQPSFTKIKDIYYEKIDRWDYPNTSSTLDPYIRQFRPVFDIDGTVLLWTRGIYNYRDFRYFNMDLMLYDIQNDKLLIDKGIANSRMASVEDDIGGLKSTVSQLIINNLTYEIPSAKNYKIEFALTAGKTYNITDKGSSGQFTMYTRETSTSANLESVGTFRAGETKQFTPSDDAGWLIGYANSATTIYIEEVGLIAPDVQELNRTAEFYEQSFIAPCSIPLEIGAISAGIPSSSDKYVRSSGFAYASKGDILTISPTDFTVTGAIYLYSAPMNSAYESGISISTIAIGDTYTYTFESDGYFKLRAQKGEAPDLTNDDIADFETIISYLHHYSYKDFNVAEISPSALSLDYDAIKAEMVGKVNFSIQTDTHMSAFYRYNGATRWNPSDFDRFESAIKAMTKLGVNGFVNLGDMVAGYGFDPDYETRESLKKIVDEYEDFGPNERFFVIGNHDDGCLFYANSTYNDNPQTTDVLFPAEQFNRITKHGNNNGFVQNYYYKDINGIRVIVLYQRDFNYSQGVPQIEQFKVGTAQLDWLTNTALDTNLPVLVLTHAPLVSSIYDTSRDGFDNVLTALNNFTSNGGTVIAVLSGHKHQEAETTLNGINHIVFTNGYVFFYLVSIDLTNRNITCTPINNNNLNVRTFNY